MSRLDEIYNEIEKPNYSFLPLKDLARGCIHITEISKNDDHILPTLLLTTKPSTLHCYREEETSLVIIKDILHDAIPKHTTFRLFKDSSIKTYIEPTEFLIFSLPISFTSATQLLTKHAPQVKKYIAFPGINHYAKRGSDGRTPGAVDGILQYLAEHPEWSIKKRIKKQDGLILLEKNPTTGSDFEKIYSMVSFDIPEVRYVERIVVGLAHPQKDWTGTELESMAQSQINRLNRALRYGMIMGVERNFTEIQCEGKSILTGYLVYHVGFKKRPADK